MNKLKEKYYIALGNLQNMAIDNTKGSKGVDICVLDINEYVTYLQSKIDKANEYLEERFIFDDKNGEYYQTHTFDKDNAKELHDILKEDK